MKTSAIDSGRIEAMMAQLKAAAQRPGGEYAAVQNGVNAAAQNGDAASKLAQTQATQRVDFAEVLKSSLNHVNQTQMNADALGKSFTMGDDKVSLSDVVIAGQKANISLQATIQVRNRLVSAYQDIMNMQV
ncbi:MAG: flagellar hook-basal body complex protein FliE [Methylobacillus glycogenes]|nr:flagellar hook-basal body complex protein FliE [Methylobacillus glycogenes]